MYLTELTKDNIESVYRFRNEKTFIENCTSRKKVSFIEFNEELKNDFSKDRLLQFVIFNSKGESVGSIYSYSYNPFDKYAFVTVYITKSKKKFSYGIKAFVVMADFLFKKFKLYKIYFDVYEYNSEMLSVLKKCNFSLEGKFIRQKLKNRGRYHVYRFAFYKKDLDIWTKKLRVSSFDIV